MISRLEKILMFGLAALTLRSSCPIFYPSFSPPQNISQERNSRELLFVAEEHRRVLALSDKLFLTPDQIKPYLNIGIPNDRLFSSYVVDGLTPEQVVPYVKADVDSAPYHVGLYIRNKVFALEVLKWKEIGVDNPYFIVDAHNVGLSCKEFMTFVDAGLSSTAKPSFDVVKYKKEGMSSSDVLQYHQAGLRDWMDIRDAYRKKMEPSVIAAKLARGCEAQAVVLEEQCH